MTHRITYNGGKEEDLAIEIVRMAQELKQYRAHVRKLAKSTALLLNIGDGDELVQIIGYGDESNNMDALCFYIHEHFEKCLDLTPKEHVEWLAKHIKQNIEEMGHMLNMH